MSEEINLVEEAAKLKRENDSLRALKFHAEEGPLSPKSLHARAVFAENALSTIIANHFGGVVAVGGDFKNAMPIVSAVSPCSDAIVISVVPRMTVGNCPDARCECGDGGIE